MKEISKKKYAFYQYKKEFPSWFEKENSVLIKILPEDAKVEHIGSTSVPGLGGKGIIDIIVSVQLKDFQKVRKNLVKLNYNFDEIGGDEERLFFSKYPKTKKHLAYHLHLTFVNSLSWKKALAVRNYLRKSKKARQEYILVKKKAVKFAKGERMKYREYKNPFLKKLTEKALKYLKKKN